MLRPALERQLRRLKELSAKEEQNVALEHSVPHVGTALPLRYGVRVG